jgi:hypothetical protein
MLVVVTIPFTIGPPVAGAAATISECRDKTKRYLARTKTYLEGQVARGNAAFYT